MAPTSPAHTAEEDTAIPEQPDQENRLPVLWGQEALEMSASITEKSWMRSKQRTSESRAAHEGAHPEGIGGAGEAEQERRKNGMMGYWKNGTQESEDRGQKRKHKEPNALTSVYFLFSTHPSNIPLFQYSEVISVQYFHGGFVMCTRSQKNITES